MIVLDGFFFLVFSVFSSLSSSSWLTKINCLGFGGRGGRGGGRFVLFPFTLESNTLEMSFLCNYVSFSFSFLSLLHSGGGRGGGRGGRGGRGGGRGGGSRVIVEPHRHEGVYISRGREDSICTKNMVPGVSVYNEKRVSVEVCLPPLFFFLF